MDTTDPPEAFREPIADENSSGKLPPSDDGASVFFEKCHRKILLRRR
jgi:hypothetical protein